MEYTDNEKRCLEALRDAANAFFALERQHPSEVEEFAFFIHGAQSIVMARFAQRHEGSGMTPVMGG